MDGGAQPNPAAEKEDAPSETPTPQTAAETEREKKKRKRAEDIAWLSFLGDPVDPDALSEDSPEKKKMKKKEKKEEEEITWTLFHDGRYLRFSVYDEIFEFTTKYNPIKIVHRGSNGIVVCSAVNTETGEQVAIKKIPNAFADKITAKRTLREMKLLLNLHHENVVGIKDVIPPPKWWEFNDVYIAYELLETNLRNIIHFSTVTPLPLLEEDRQGGLGFFLCHVGGVVLACDFIGDENSSHTEAIVASWSDSLCNVT